MKKIAFFSTSLPDLTQGGTGITNYLFCDYLIKNNFYIEGFFRTNKKFISESNQTSLDYLKNLGVKINIIDDGDYYEESFLSKLKFGYEYLKKIYHVNFLKKYLKKIDLNFDGYICYDLGWILALSSTNIKNCIGILNDPIHQRIKFGSNLTFNLKDNFNYFRGVFLGSKNVIKKINQEVKKDFKIFSFSEHHADEYTSKGLKCNVIPYSSEYIPKNKIKQSFDIENKIKILHVGDLRTSVGRSFIKFFKDEIELILSRLKFEFEFNFVGKYEKKIFSDYKNIKLNFHGFQNNIEKYYKKNDLYLVISSYPVGTRTRVITSQSFGLPCITDINAKKGIPLLENNKNCFLLDKKKKLDEIFHKIINEKDLLKKVSINARNYWEQNHNPMKNIQKLINMLDI